MTRLAVYEHMHLGGILVDVVLFFEQVLGHQKVAQRLQVVTTVDY